MSIKLGINEQEQKETNRGGGDFFHVEVRDQREFKRFRTQPNGADGSIERVAGQRADGTWETVKWLVSKKMARLENDELVAVSEAARSLFKRFGANPKHVSGDRFEAKI